MSRLVFEGDLNKNFGEFYPTPYVDQVVVKDSLDEKGRKAYELIVDLSLLFTVPESDPYLPSLDSDFVGDIIDRVNINLLFTKSMHGYLDAEWLTGRPEASRAPEAHPDAVDWVAKRSEYVNRRLSEYTNATGVDYTKAEDPLDELSLILYDPSILPQFLVNPPVSPPDDGIDEGQISEGLGYDIVDVDGSIFLDAIRSGEKVVIYDKTGRKFIKVKATITHILKISYRDLATGDTARPDEANINLLAFCSMMTPEQMRESGITTNATLKMLFGDVAYERIMNKGAISNQTEISYFDDNNDVYMDTPLQTIQETYHKTDTTTHQDIYKKFTQVLKSYVNIIPGSAQDIQSADPELMGSIEVIQLALMNYKNKPNLINKLAAARKQIINRSPGTRTGALYADMAKMLGRVNDVVGRGTPLTKKLTINAKILDRRRERLSGYELPAPSSVDEKDLFNIMWGRTVVWTNKFSSTFNVSDYLSDELFAGLMSSGIMGGTEGEHRSTTTSGQFMGDMKVVYLPDGSIKIMYNSPEHGGMKEVIVPGSEFTGLFEDQFTVKEEFNVTNGFAFFDYTRAVRKDSILSTLVDVDKFVSHFGWGMVQKYYVPYIFRLAKNKPSYPETMPGSAVVLMMSDHSAEDSSNRALVFSKVMTKDGPPGGFPPEYYPGTEAPVEDNNGHVYRHSDYPILENPEVIQISATQQMQHYVAERNVSYMPAYTDEEMEAVSPAIQEYHRTYGDPQAYKLMTFEFQNFDSMATYMRFGHQVYDQYKFEVEVLDYTKASLVHIIKHYYWLYMALQQYLIDASQECSYNNVDGVFNDFFAEQMKMKFITNPAGAPWIFLPVVYVRHVDFLTNKYGGDQNEMLLAAREIIQRISPETGTLDQLKAFYQNYIDLYETYYSPSSVIGRRLLEYSTGTEGAMYDYSSYYGLHKIYTSDWYHDVQYSYQAEGGRDNFLQAIVAAREEYETASDAFRDALDDSIAATKETMRQLFEDRDARYNEKIKYEIDLSSRVSTGGSKKGCRYTIWWDGFNQKVSFASIIGSLPSKDTKGETITSPDEFQNVHPDGIANRKYGYFWVNPHKRDEIVERYPVEEYGEPTVFSNLFKDEEKIGKSGAIRTCRYIPRAYRFRQKSFRDKRKAGSTVQASGDGVSFSRFGGQPDGKSGDPVTKHMVKFYDLDARDASEREEMQELLESEHFGEGGSRWYYERRLPGFEAIYDYKTYEDWLADAEAGIDTSSTIARLTDEKNEAKSGITDQGIGEYVTDSMWIDSDDR